MTTETPPEALIPPEPPAPDPDPELVDEGDEVDPERDADGVDEDRLTGVAVYDNAELRYVTGVFKNKTALRADETARELVKDAGRYSVRRV